MAFRAGKRKDGGGHMAIQNVGGSQYQSNSTLSSQLNRKERELQSVTEMIRESREKLETHRKNMDKFKKANRSANYGNAAMEAYIRLGRARNRAQVNAASGYARWRITQLQAALRSDSDNAPAIKGAIRQLQKAIRRGEKKKSDLAREEVLEKRRKASQSRKKAERANQELKRRRAQRAIRESGYLREAEIDKRQNAMLTATRLALREQAQSLQAATGAALENAIGRYAVQAAPETAAPPGGTVDAQA